MKVCSVCKIEKDISEFRHRKDKNLYMTYCRPCERLKNKKYKIENKEKVSVYNKQYMTLYNKQYYQENSQELIEYQAQYKLNNPDKIKESNKLYFIKNRDKRIKYQIEYKKKRLKTDPVFKLRETVAAYIRMFVKKGRKSTSKYLDYSFKELKENLEKQFKPWMTWDNWGVYNLDTWNDDDPSTWTWNIDHIIPHSNFKYESMEDQSFKDCWALNNLRPYSAKQNVIDGNRR